MYELLLLKFYNEKLFCVLFAKKFFLPHANYFRCHYVTIIIMYGNIQKNIHDSKYFSEIKNIKVSFFLFDCYVKYWFTMFKTTMHLKPTKHTAYLRAENLSYLFITLFFLGTFFSNSNCIHITQKLIYYYVIFLNFKKFLKHML